MDFVDFTVCSLPTLIGTARTGRTLVKTGIFTGRRSRKVSQEGQEDGNQLAIHSGMLPLHAKENPTT
jgi:hypothetical protein